jgi:hypothetical protein
MCVCTNTYASLYLVSSLINYSFFIGGLPPPAPPAWGLRPQTPAGVSFSALVFYANTEQREYITTMLNDMCMYVRLVCMYVCRVSCACMYVCMCMCVKVVCVKVARTLRVLLTSKLWHYSFGIITSDV